MNRDLNAPLHLPAGLNYACLQCGRGCEDFDDIEVDPVTQEGFERLGVGALARDGKPACEQSQWNVDERIMRKIRGEKGIRPCCLLTDEKLCGVHCAHGIESKPLVCRSFPFAFVETPGGVYTRMSFACTAVLQNHGPSISTQGADIRETYGFTPSVRRAPDEILLAPGVPLTWEQYLAIEQDLDDILTAPSPSISTALLAQAAYLRMLTNLLRQARESAGAARGENPEAGAKALEVFRKGMGQSPDGPRWHRLFKLAAKPGGSPILRRTTLGFVLTLRHIGAKKRGRAVAGGMMFVSYLRSAFGVGNIPLLREADIIPYSRVRQMRFDPNRPEHRELLGRYFRHALFRKDLLLQDEMAFGHSMMLLNYGFMHWYAAALAASGGRDEVGIEDLTEAVRRVEEFFGLHSPLARVLGQHPGLKAILEGLFHRPAFAYAMARGEGEAARVSPSAT